MRIGIFDSGIGGLTVLKEIVKTNPNHQYYYFGDNINAPYGSKTKNELLILTNRIIDFLKQKEVDIIIIACGTVSSTIYKQLKCDIPIYDIISPTINYLNNSNYQNIGIIATENTIKSNMFQKKVSKPLITKATPLLVPLIESDSDHKKQLETYLNPIKDKLGALVLGCTHYPIIESDIKNILNQTTDIINMGKILADNLTLEGKDKFKVRMYFTKINHTLIENIDKIVDFDYSLEEV